MPTAPPSVLLADDDPALRELPAAQLGYAGCAVTAVPDGAQALRLLADPVWECAAAVPDRRTPGLTGPEVLARVRPTRPALPVLVLSGDADAPTVAAVRSDPFAAFLAKPLRAAELTGAVAGLVARPRAGLADCPRPRGVPANSHG